MGSSSVTPRDAGPASRGVPGLGTRRYSPSRPPARRPRYCGSIFAAAMQRAHFARSERANPAHAPSDGARHTAITNVFTGRPARGIVNRIVRELGPVSPAAELTRALAARP